MTGTLVWFTGLSGSGKTTLAKALQKRLASKSVLLDGDELRKGVCNDLDFSFIDRRENMRRAGELSKLLVDQGFIVLASFISPNNFDRQLIRGLINIKYIEVYCQCTLDVCIKRDVKGLYKLALENKIQSFTGISSPYDIPVNPEIIVDTENYSINECADKIFNFMKRHNFYT